MCVHLGGASGMMRGMADRPIGLVEFTQLAENFCAAIEASPEDDLFNVSAWRLRADLAALLAAGFRLPEIDPTDEDFPDGPSSERSQGVFRHLRTRFGDKDTYWTNFNVWGNGADAVTAGSLADDLADIWSDLRRGLDALAAGTPWQDVAWEWRFGLETHWGRHAVEALRALHDI